jgi:hypothetical protein
MKRASASMCASLIAAALIPACVLEVQDDPYGGGWNGSHRGGGQGGASGSNTWKLPDAGPRADGGQTRSSDASKPPVDAPKPPSPPDAAPMPMPTPDAGAPATPEPICRHSGQCVMGRCHEGACQRPCGDDDACGTGDICTEGFCQPDPKPGDECIYTVECGGHALCVNGRCHQQCNADDDCESSADRCDRGLCRPDVRPIPQCTANSDCPPDRTCVDAVCRNPCRDDSQCGPNCSGTVCSNGFCFMPEELVPPPCSPVPPSCGSNPGCGGTCTQP